MSCPPTRPRVGSKAGRATGADAENFNEIRFEDKKGSEEMYIHAEKDQNTVVENDQEDCRSDMTGLSPLSGTEVWW